MDYVRAPKRTRKERGCVSRTYMKYTIEVALYDRSAKEEITDTFDQIGKVLTDAELGKLAGSFAVSSYPECAYLGFDVVKTEEVRFYMSDSDFIKFATLAE